MNQINAKSRAEGCHGLGLGRAHLHRSEVHCPYSSTAGMQLYSVLQLIAMNEVHRMYVGLTR